jgi:glycosyltransferase involved in cell wall biosynthesis
MQRHANRGMALERRDHGRVRPLGRLREDVLEVADGLVVVEAAARGTPVIVVRDPDNAAADLVSEGQNGLVAESAEPDALAAAIVAVHADGTAFVERTRRWFRENADRLSIDASLVQIEEAYATVAGRLRATTPRSI